MKKYAYKVIPVLITAIAISSLYSMSSFAQNSIISSSDINLGDELTIGAGYYDEDTIIQIPTVHDIIARNEITMDDLVAENVMVNNGEVKPDELSAGSSYVIPEGYHNGKGIVKAKSLASQTGVDNGKSAVTTSQILTGYQAWVNGSKVTGSMPNQGAKTQALNPGGSFVIPAGYHNGSGKITANANTGTYTYPANSTGGTVDMGVANLNRYVNATNVYNKGVADADARANTNSTNYKTGYNAGVASTTGTATASQILSGYTAWVNGNKVTGTMAQCSASNITLSGNSSKTYSAGYYPSSWTVTSDGISEVKWGTLSSWTSSGQSFTNLKISDYDYMYLAIFNRDEYGNYIPDIWGSGPFATIISTKDFSSTSKVIKWEGVGGGSGTWQCEYLSDTKIKITPSGGLEGIKSAFVFIK